MYPEYISYIDLYKNKKTLSGKYIHSSSYCVFTNVVFAFANFNYVLFITQ